MNDTEQAQHRRIGVLRQTVSLLRGTRDKASPETMADWANELERLADMEAMERRDQDSRVSYRNIVGYLRAELGLDRDKIKEMLGEHVKRLVGDSVQKTIRERVDEALTTARLWLNCGHDHQTQGEAEACAWEPDNAPVVYAGRVIQVHPSYFTRFAQGRMPWEERPLRQAGKYRVGAKETPNADSKRQVNMFEETP